MRLIPLTQGQFAMVDDADFERVNAHKWYAEKHGRNFHALRSRRKPDGTWGTQYLHQFLMPGVPQIDHRDGNGLNNQRENLRPATTRQNSQGFRQKRPGLTSQFRGVCWSKQKRKWEAKITVNGKGVHLGFFTDEIEAAHAYDSGAVFYFGEYASPNFDIGQITIT